MRRTLTTIAAALGVLIPALVASTPAATAAGNFELVTHLPYPEATHLEFMTREIDWDLDEVPETRHYAIGGSRHGTQGGVRIFDITDPQNAFQVLHVPCFQSPQDVAVTNSGPTWYLVMGNQSAGGGCRIGGPTGPKGRTISVMDITDLRNPVFLGWPVSPAPFANKGAHTVVPHPTRPLIYIASQSLPDRSPTIEIADLTSWPPTLTVAPLPPTGLGPHDITFNASGTRAYVSSINISLVLDTTNPLAPTLVSVIQDPEVKVHHEAVLHPNGRHLLVVDESVAAPPAGTPVCPGGGVVVFDLGPGGAWEQAPVRVGSFYANDVSIPSLEEPTPPPAEVDPSCTAHEYSISADGRWMPIGWMGAGVRAFDLTDLVDATASPVPTPVVVPEIGYYASFRDDVWAAKAHHSAPGYVFVSDTSQGPGLSGFKVLRYTGQLP